MVDAFTAVFVGLAAGMLSGLFGLGGAIITTPAVRLLLGRPELIAVGTPLLVVVPSTLTGAWVYARRGSADMRVGLTVGMTGIPTAVLGAWIADVVGGGPILIATAVLIGYLAIRMLGDVVDTSSIERDRGQGTVSWTRHAGLGMAAGFVSGLMGLGGGFLIVPALITWFDYPVKRAIGTSLVAITVFAVPGAVVHYAFGHVDTRLAFFLALGTVPGAFLGACFTAAAQERHIRIAFAVILALTGILLGVREGVTLLGG